MSAPRDYRLFLGDILTETKLAQQFIAGVKYEQFVENPEKQRALERSLEIIGEATRNIPAKIRKKYPEVKWKKMVGMRDRVSHGYFGIDLEIVWDTVKRDLPVPQEQLERILGETESPTRETNE